MGAYSVIGEFGGSYDDISVAPYWVVAVWPWARRVTWDRSKISNSTVNISKNTDLSDAGRTGPIVLMHRDCTTLRVDGNKSNYIHQMTATFSESGKQYLNKVFPGDWCAAWIVYGREKYQDLLKRLSQGQPCNEFDSGLKFVGKVLSFRRKSNVNEGGIKTQKYNLVGLGFKEFGNSLYFDPDLVQNLPFFSQLSGQLNAATAYLEALGPKQGIDSNTFLPLALAVVLGQGAKSSFVLPHEVFDTATAASEEGATAGGSPTPKLAYVIPNQVARMLNRSAMGSSTGLYSYVDILETVIGVQKYGPGIDQSTAPAANSDLLNIDDPGQQTGPPKSPVTDVFIPKGAKSPNTLHLLGKESPNYDLLGSFLMIPNPFFGHPLWNWMNQFLNPVVNEMYTTLRVNYNGEIMPTLVARQRPFSTGLYSSQGVTLTEFLELPRWTIDPILVKDEDIGRGDQLHVNFGQVSAASVIATPAVSLAAQHAVNPPIVDEEDYHRHGLQAFQETVHTGVNDAAGKAPHTWTEMVMDWHLGEHLFFNGTLATQGISAPICVGDNLEWDNVVYHIESVGHQCAMSPDGHVRSFLSFFQLSHGMRSDNDTKKVIPASNEASPNGGTATNSDLLNPVGFDSATANLDTTVAAPDVAIYPGLDENDNALPSPGLTGDFEDDPTPAPQGTESGGGGG